MYVLEDGKLDCTKVFAGQTEPTFLKEYQPGEGFGELALLRGEPRAASIIAKTAVSTVSIDRHAFKRMLGPLEELLKRNVDLYTQYKKAE